jgi:hypothetical protein
MLIAFGRLRIRPRRPLFRRIAYWAVSRATASSFSHARNRQEGGEKLFGNPSLIPSALIHAWPINSLPSQAASLVARSTALHLQTRWAGKAQRLHHTWAGRQ